MIASPALDWNNAGPGRYSISTLIPPNLYNIRKRDRSTLALALVSHVYIVASGKVDDGKSVVDKYSSVDWTLDGS